MKTFLIIVAAIVVGLLVFIAISGLLAGACLSAAASSLARSSTLGTTAYSSPAPATTYRIGDAAKSIDYTLTVNSVETMASISPYPGPGAGKMYLVVDVTIDTTVGTTYNPTYFAVQDAAGYEHGQSWTALPNNALHSGTLKAGGRIRGAIAFEVPTGSTGLVLKYDPRPWTSSHQVRVALN